jgi:hypothetical protein
MYYPQPTPAAVPAKSPVVAAEAAGIVSNIFMTSLNHESTQQYNQF